MYAILVITIIARTATDISFKKAMTAIPKKKENIYITALKSPFFWIGLACGGTNFLCWYISLSHFDLSFAYPFLSICYITIILSGKFIFKEHLDNYKLIGIGFISLGAIGLFLG
jgi:multidrug transporter EmrE-like cation transporter